MKQLAQLFILCLTFSCVNAQEGKLFKTNLFEIPTEKFEQSSGFTFKIACDSKENIAFNACSLPYVYLYNNAGTQFDSIKLPTTKCIRNMEFDEYDNLLMMDNDETNIYRYNIESKKLEVVNYTKPEDWFKMLNHYFRNFEIPSIPTYYSNNDYLQDFYFTRFPYSYNLFLNYKNGYVYQTHYNFIKRITNHKTYSNLRKVDYWFSDNLTPKSKILLIDDEKQAIVYYDRFYNLIYENFTNSMLFVNPALGTNSEPARFDYCSNVKQNKIYGIGGFNKKAIQISSWSF